MPYSWQQLEQFAVPIEVINVEVGDLVGGVSKLNKIPGWLRSKLSTVSDKTSGDDPSARDFNCLCDLLELDAQYSPADAWATFAQSKRGLDAVLRVHDMGAYREHTMKKAVVKTRKEGDLNNEIAIEEIDGEGWRAEFKSKNQLCRTTPHAVIQSLVPEKALTMITAPSFHGKSWLALHLGK